MLYSTTKRRENEEREIKVITVVVQCIVTNIYCIKYTITIVAQ